MGRTAVNERQIGGGRHPTGAARAHTSGSGRLDIPLFYLGMTAVTLVGQLLAGRDLDR